MITTHVRKAEASDNLGILTMHEQIEEALGMAMDLPFVDDAAILEYFIAERDGKPVSGLYIEKCVEMCFVGTDPEGTAALREIEEEIFRSSADAGVRTAHCMVPAEMADAVGKHLQKSGFEPTGYVHFRRSL